MWKDIRGYEGLYQINEYGQVKSLSRYIQNHSKLQLIPERILKPCRAGRGYLAVSLRKNNKTYRKYIHQIVAEMFIENPNNLPVPNHKDGNKLNNCYENLEWSTYSENNQHAYDTNLKFRGEDFYNAILTEKNVKEILKNGKCGTYQDIADNYGVSKATIRDVLIRKTWKHIHV
ncbi:MAG: NUMOD4 domain-containing protein [Methanofastidiosum sp.]